MALLPENSFPTMVCISYQPDGKCTPAGSLLFLIWPAMHQQ
ncbi:hypothetical protein V6x_15520 [Gimesia chilikensis]|uniref:Uncharacterized protein n=1 Tax=Gimesia chilikensis TaxID=2605989 RepID=A0A517W9C8_9PLAN|nr:hypothetical protein V6x_15520 [Gimesia chilikensis]